MGRGAYHAHACAEDVDKSLVIDGLGAGEEKVGDGEVEEGEGGDDGAGGDERHGGSSRERAAELKNYRNEAIRRNASALSGAEGDGGMGIQGWALAFSIFVIPLG